MLDLRPLVQITYELEGERLELLLLYERVERLRDLGEAIASGSEGPLVNVDGALRSDISLSNGVTVEKVQRLAYHTKLFCDLTHISHMFSCVVWSNSCFLALEDHWSSHGGVYVVCRS